MRYSNIGTARDNSYASLLMVNPRRSRVNLPSWRVGNVTVMRKDKKPLTVEAIQTIATFHTLVLFVEDFHTAKSKMNQFSFRLFCEGYKAYKIAEGVRSFRDLELPL
ncbi:hypothetical protein VNI00_008583 [Paramarasmius palmivorus]|uniref:Uncharacterized protein n=1 Tax=Paramarasmius palmivorus TaxID=297713 RepID=A0AAW0CY77_9AGAR